MGLLWTYLKTRLGSLALIAALCAVFLAVGWLSGMTGERIGYALLLCAAVTAVAAAADIRHFYVRHRELSVAMRQILVSLDNLPSAETQQEEDYREMAVLLHDDAVAALHRGREEDGWDPRACAVLEQLASAATQRTA